ncbi:MAG: type II toxin-antitoxin system Phd/YefM family antitoxin [Burkholderiaceae bacterium]|nr:type II toxin-antitoxin system Phd/YefM family antitoxin [Burkholderiaceae bacterium]
MKTITATDLARKTREVLDAVLRDRQTVLIERNHIAIAQITPPQCSMTVAQALTLVRPGLTAAEGRRWLKESRGNFDEKRRDPWA